MFWLLMTVTGAAACGAWEEDFRYQPTSTRPALEVCYTSAAREAFEIRAADFALIGQTASAPSSRGSGNGPGLVDALGDRCRWRPLRHAARRSSRRASICIGAGPITAKFTGWICR